jgi:hypothetical protein
MLRAKVTERDPPYRHVELEVRGALDPERRRRAEGHEPGRGVDGPARRPRGDVVGTDLVEAGV